MKQTRFQQGAKDSDSDDEDYRKANRRAQKGQQRQSLNSLPPEDFDMGLFASRLLQERGRSLATANFKELERDLKKYQNNVGQTCQIMKSILELAGLEQDKRIYYSVIRSELLLRNKMYEECKVACEKSLQFSLSVLDRIRVQVTMSQAQNESGEHWNAQMQILRASGQLKELKKVKQIEMTGPFDKSVEDVYRSVEDVQLSVKVKCQKDKKSVGLVLIQGSSSTGGLGLGDDTQNQREAQFIVQLRNRQVIQIACGEHHILALVSGCSCFNPFAPKFDCKVEECNYGYEVFGWGENFLGQALIDPEAGNFISTPTNLSFFSSKKLVGIAAYKSTSLAWTKSGQVYQWGVKDEPNIKADENVILKQSLQVQDLGTIKIGHGFYALLTNSKQLYIQGGLQTSIASQPLVHYKKPTKIDQVEGIIAQIACGDYHLLALTADTKVYGIGSNEFGQLGMKPSQCLFQQKFVCIFEDAYSISATQNLSMITSQEGELLYAGQVNELSKLLSYQYLFQKEHVDYFKSAQVPDDGPIIHSDAQGTLIYAMNSNGTVYKWDPDTDAKFKLYCTGSIRQFYLARGICVLQQQVLQGRYCKVQPKDDDAEYFTYEDIDLIIELNDDFGPYGVKQVHPIRYHYLLTEKRNLSLKEIIEDSQLTTLKSIKNQQEPKIYQTELQEKRLLNCQIEPLLEDPSRHKVTLKVKENGIYDFYILLNEELIDGCPLQLNVGKGLQEDNLQQSKKMDEELKLQIEADKQKKKMEKQRLEEEQRLKLQQEQEQAEQKRQETKRRAEEALVAHKLKQQEEARKIELERKAKKDLLTGGGFDLDKISKQKSQQDIPKRPLQQQQQQQQSEPQVEQQQLKQQQPQASNAIKIQLQKKIIAAVIDPQKIKEFTIRQNSLRRSQVQQPQQPVKPRVELKPVRLPSRQEMNSSQVSKESGQNSPMSMSGVGRQSYRSVDRQAQTMGSFGKQSYLPKVNMNSTETQFGKFGQQQKVNVNNLVDPFQMQMQMIQNMEAQQLKQQKPMKRPIRKN